ncbi:MAG: hypothetical protein HQ481_16325 [Alphaproteobacteria bacterium]|nr:hypothetical protein [Alphaproteobacteria bacterium]
MTLWRPTTREPGAGSSQPLFLSLFLLLLAFFILLNSLSSIEVGRSNRVLQSVQDAFPSSVRREVGDAQLDGDPGQVIGDALRAQIGAVFKALLPVAEVTVEPGGNPLYVEVPIRLAWQPSAGGVTPVMEELADQLRPIVARPPTGSVLRVQILFGINGLDDGNERALRVTAASTVVETFARAGIDPSRLSSGLEPWDSDTVRLVFRTAPAGSRGPDFGAPRRDSSGGG